MTYRIVLPDRRAAWISKVPDALIRTALDSGGRLAVFAWDWSDQPATDDLIRIALRSGRPCAEGIAIESRFVADLDRPDMLRESFGQVERSMDRIGQSEGLEPMRAGTDSQIGQSSHRNAALLAAPPLPALLDHWQELGGVTPHPA